MQVLSSRATPFYRFFTPLAWVLLLVFFAPFIKDATDHYEIILVVVLLGACLFFWHGSRLRKVTLDRELLVISSYSREVSVPLTSISQVKGSRWAKTKDVIITFDHDIGFGDKVVFVPKSRWLWPWQEHPIAAEMRKLAGIAETNARG